MQTEKGPMRASFRFPYEQYGFRHFTVEDRELLDCHLAKMPGILSSYTCFANLILWDDWTRVFCREWGEYLCLLLEEGPSDQWQVMPPLGPYDAAHQGELTTLFQNLERMFHENSLDFSCCEIKDWMFPFLEQTGLSWDFYYGRENSDYLYRTEDFQAALNHSKVQYNIRHLFRRHRVEFRELRNVDMPLWEQVLEETFCRSHPCAECTEGCQKRVLRYGIQNHDLLGLKGFLVFVDERPLGYVSVSRERDVLIFQALKQQRGVRGLLEWMHEQALSRYGEGACWINYTEDMGREGLRRHKQNLAPHVLSHNYEGETSYLAKEETR